MRTLQGSVPHATRNRPLATGNRRSESRPRLRREAANACERGSGRCRSTAWGLQRQLGRIKAPMAADAPGPRDSAGGSRARECLRVDAQMLGGLMRGEETVARLALVQQRAQLVTRAGVRTQLVENRQNRVCARLAPQRRSRPSVLQGDWRAHVRVIARSWTHASLASCSDHPAARSVVMRWPASSPISAASWRRRSAALW